MDATNVIFEPATDGKSTLRYVVGNDAQEMSNEMKLEKKLFRQGVEQLFYSK